MPIFAPVRSDFTPVINRRVLGALALGATLSACGGGSDSPVAPPTIATQPFGEVVASRWSEQLPTLRQPTSPVQYGYVAVGASGLVYADARENNEYVLKRYQPDGSGVETFRLPSISRGFSQVSVLEDPDSGDVLIARSVITGARQLNAYLAGGGAIYRLNPRSGQFTTLFASDTITPSGLARDRAGNLYTLDIRTGDVLQLSKASQQITFLYQVNAVLPPRDEWSWDLGLEGARGTVAVTDDGTVYATLTGSSVAGSPFYERGAKLLRLRQGKADLISGSSAGEQALFSRFASYGNSLFFLIYSNGTRVLRKLDASGKVFTIAGTLGAQGATQFGTPGVLSNTTEWIGLTPDGRVHLESNDASGPKFFDVVLPAESAGT